MESTQSTQSTQPGQITLPPFKVKIYPHGAIYLPKPIRKLLALELTSTRTLDARLTFMPGKVVISIEIPVLQGA